jgi:hypothetical protein
MKYIGQKLTTEDTEKKYLKPAGSSNQGLFIKLFRAREIISPRFATLILKTKNVAY